MTAWATVELTVATPVFNGGGYKPRDEAAHSDDIRVPSLRGAMRFWFRTLAGAVTGPDWATLRRLEGEVFGDTDADCPVPLRIPSPPKAEALDVDTNWDQNRWVVYLLGQGLGDLPGRSVRRPCVLPDRTFALHLRLGGASDRVGALTLAALWLLCAYGGVGARTRRGFGGLRITGVDGRLPAPWIPETLRTPDADHFADLASLWPPQVEQWLPLLGDGLPGPSDAWPVLPQIPVLSSRHTLAGLTPTGRGWRATLAHAGQELRHFRANVDAPGARYHPARKSYEWLNVLNPPSRNDFRVGALGLPVVYSGKNREVNATRGTERLRRASPLWLRPVGTGTGMRLLSFAFLGQFLPDPAVRVHLWQHSSRDRALDVTDADVRSLATQWISTLSAGGSFTDPTVRRT